MSPCLSLSVCGLIATATRAADPPRRLFRDTLGVNAKFAQGEPMADLPLLKQLGVRWVRDSVLWRDIEPTAGTYRPFPADFQRRLAYYTSNGIGVCFLAAYDDPAAYPNTPADPAHSTDPAAYGRYAAEIARRLNAAGVRHVIEFYNEPHNTLGWIGGTWNGAPPCPWLDRYVAMVRAATTAVRAVDPAVPLLVDDDMWIIHWHLLDLGLPKDIGGLAVHPYVKGWPEHAAVEQDTGWCRPYEVVGPDGSFRSAVERLRDRAAAKLGHAPAIWSTEWGWPIGGNVAGRTVTDAELSGIIPRAYLTAADAGVEVTCWFSLYDSVDGPMGLTGADGKRRPQFDAYRVMAERLGGRTVPPQHVAGADHPTVGVQAYRLDRPDGSDPILVAWHVAGNQDVWLDGVAGPVAVSATDVLDRPVPIDRVGGRYRLALTRSPVYVHHAGPAATVTPGAESHVPPAVLFP